MQAYGEDHRFEILDPPEGGFAVMIEIPVERRESAIPPKEPPRLAAAAN